MGRFFQQLANKLGTLMTTTKQNLLHGYKVRLAGLIRRGESQEKIDTVKNLIKQMESKNV